MAAKLDHLRGDVSCRATGYTIQQLKRMGLPVDHLSCGTSLTIEDFQNPSGFIMWDDYLHFVHNCQGHLSVEQLVELCTSYMGSAYLRPLLSAAGLWYHPSKYFKWVADSNYGAIQQLFTCVKPYFLQINDREVVIEELLSPGFTLPPNIFWESQAIAFGALTTYFGLAPSIVTWEPRARGAAFRIKLPRRRPLQYMLWWLTSWIRRDNAEDVRSALAFGHERSLRLEREVAERNRVEQALRESEERLRRITNAVPSIVFQYFLESDGRQGFIFVSGGAVTLTGYTPEELIANPKIVWEQVDKDHISRLQESILDSARTGTPWQLEFLFLTRSGESRWARGRAIPDPVTESGRVVWNGILTDVTAERNADAQLRAQDAVVRLGEERFRRLIENSHDVVALYDVTGKILYQSPSVTRVLGFEPEDLIGKTAMELCHPADLPAAMSNQAQVIANPDRALPVEIRCRCKDGSYKWLEFVGMNLLDEPSVRALVGNYRDITERKRAEQALRESEERFRAYIDNAPNGLFVLDESGRYIDVNPAACRLSGYEREELLRMGIGDLSSPEDRSRLHHTLGHLESEIAIEFQWSMRQKTGEKRHVSIAAVRLSDGRTMGFVTDMTERMLASQALLSSNERLQLALTAATAVGFTWDAVSDSVVRYFSTVSSLPMNLDRPESVSAVRSRVHPDDVQLFDRGVAECLRDYETQYRNLYRIVNPDGSFRWLQEWGTLIRDSLGKPLKLNGISIDVTAQKLAEAQRDDILNRLLLQIDRMPIAFITYDPELLISGWNPAAEKIFGYRSDEILGSPAEVLVHEEDLDHVSKILARLREGDIQAHSINRNVTKSGHVIMCEWHNTPIYTPDGKFNGFQSMTQDITEKAQAIAALRESEEQYRSLVNAMSEGVLVQDWMGKILASNPSALNILEMNSDQLHGRSFTDPSWNWFKEDGSYFPGENHPAMVTLRTGRSCHNVIMGVEQSDKKLTWLSINSEPLIRPGESLPYGAVCSFSDITERIRAEDALRKSEQRLRLALTAAKMGIFDWDLGTNKIVWSDTHYELFGYPPGDKFPVNYRHFSERVHPEDLPVVERAIREAMDQRTTYKCEQRILLPDARTRWIHGTGEFHYDSEGRPVRMLGTVSDISDRKQAESEMLMWDRAIKAVNQGIVITNPNLPDNPIVYVSPGYERLTGYTSSESVGRNCRFIQGHETDMAEAKRIAAAVRAADSYSGEILNYRKDGSPFWNELFISPVRDSSGKLTHFVGIQTDVTTRRGLQDQLRQAQKMEAIGQLAGGVAHDFNNLLTVINGYSEIVLTQMSPDHQLWDVLVAIREAGERAAALTKQLLAFSRRSIVAPQVLDVNKLVASSVKMLRPLIGEDIDLKTILCTIPYLVRIDPGQLEQVVINLAVNARDAMPLGGRLTIETSLEEFFQESHSCIPGRYVQINVTDTGTGMSDEVKERIFEPFFTTKGVGKGTGLGLATVYGIVKQFGGSVQVISRLGVGTTFKVLLPEVVVDNFRQPGEVVSQPIPYGTETILFAEDEDAVRNLYRMALEMQGYTVLEASTGLDAVKLADAYVGTIDLILTDVVMPNLGGRGLVEAVRSKRPLVRVLYVSGYTDDAIIRHGVAVDADAFLQKPFTPLSLLRKVREVLDAPNII